jgi:hypothetical protein
MGEWRYSFIILDLGIRWRSMVSSIRGERAPGTHWIGGWVSPRARLDTGE